jgi:hypothetical protein
LGEVTLQVACCHDNRLHSTHACGRGTACVGAGLGKLIGKRGVGEEEGA